MHIEGACGARRTAESRRTATANNQQPTTNSQQPTANSQQPTANSQQPTANSQLLDAKAQRRKGFGRGRGRRRYFDESILCELREQLLFPKQLRGVKARGGSHRE
jgi:hypothetical protein